jgi:hypothetical protein
MAKMKKINYFCSPKHSSITITQSYYSFYAKSDIEMQRKWREILAKLVNTSIIPLFSVFWSVISFRLNQLIAFGWNCQMHWYCFSVLEQLSLSNKKITDFEYSASIPMQILHKILLIFLKFCVIFVNNQVW